MKVTWQDVIIFIFLVIIIGLPFFVNNQAYASKKDNTFLFLRNIKQERFFYPLVKNKVEYLRPTTSASFSVLVNPLDDRDDKVLFKNNYQSSLPMASITKLMTAVVVLENYDLDDYITLTSQDLNIEGGIGNLHVGEVIKIKDLLYVLLIESNNGAAEALARKMGRSDFISKMNVKASKLKMIKTNYLNPTGLDIEGVSDTNRTTPDDLKRLVVDIMNTQPLIPEILKNIRYVAYGKDGTVHNLLNTNILLSEDKSILWGKTGLTDKAKGCLILVLKPEHFSFSGKRYIINVIIGAEDRFEEARRIKSWLDNQFIW